MRRKSKHVRAPMLFPGRAEKESAGDVGNVGVILKAAKRRLLVKRAVLTLVFIILFVATAIFVFSGNLDALIQRFIQEMG